MPLSNPPSQLNLPTLSITKSSSATITTTAVSIAAINPSRRGLIIANPNASSTFFVDINNAVSAFDYMVALAPGAYYEMPLTNGNYTGTLFAICPAGYGAGGSLLIREFNS